MKKIMFNDVYRLTQAVLEGWKTQTRRIIPLSAEDEEYLDTAFDWDLRESVIIDRYARYKVGEVVAVAQSYGNCGTWFFPVAEYGHMAGYTNKMFVRADEMLHRIKITNVRVERLQDISEEDCLKEGIKFKPIGTSPCYWVLDVGFSNVKSAFRNLIDKTCGRGTWDSNPWVFVYDFELVK